MGITGATWGAPRPDGVEGISQRRCVREGFHRAPAAARSPDPREVGGDDLDSFGRFGAGGSLGFGDPDAHVAFAYAMN